MYLLFPMTSLMTFFLSLAYFTVRILHITHTPYKICVNWLHYYYKARLLVVKSWEGRSKVIHGFMTMQGVSTRPPWHCLRVNCTHFNLKIFVGENNGNSMSDPRIPRAENFKCQMICIEVLHWYKLSSYDNFLTKHGPRSSHNGHHYLQKVANQMQFFVKWDFREITRNKMLYSKGKVWFWG